IGMLQIVEEMFSFLNISSSLLGRISFISAPILCSVSPLPFLSSLIFSSSLLHEANVKTASPNRTNPFSRFMCFNIVIFLIVNYTFSIELDQRLMWPVSSGRSFPFMGINFIACPSGQRLHQNSLNAWGVPPIFEIYVYSDASQGVAPPGLISTLSRLLYGKLG